MKEKRRFIVYVPVTNVHGHQCFEVMATSEKDAVRVWRLDGGECVGEDIEVTGLDSDEAYAQEEEIEDESH